MEEILSLTSIDIYAASDETLEDWIHKCDYILGGDHDEQDEDILERIADFLELCEDELSIRGN